MPKRVKNLILGQGLAGTLLSYELLKRGEEVLVVDNGDPKAASRVAAGLMSPITGQRTALAWRAEAQISKAAESYGAMEALLGGRFYFPLPLTRLYVDDEQRRRFVARKNEAAHAAWLGAETESSIEIRGAGRLDAAGLCGAWRERLIQEGRLIEADYKPEDFDAERVVACLGLGELKIGTFDFLKFQPTKGEMLTVESRAPQNGIRYGAHFALPLGGRRFRVGSTYDRENPVPGPTAEGRALLEASARTLLGDFSVLSHDYGARPNLLGHFPVLGAHPTIPGLSIFNGLGSKGALWAPYCGKLLSDWLLDQVEIPKELNVSRFY